MQCALPGQGHTTGRRVCSLPYTGWPCPCNVHFQDRPIQQAEGCATGIQGTHKSTLKSLGHNQTPLIFGTLSTVQMYQLLFYEYILLTRGAHMSEVVCVPKLPPQYFIDNLLGPSGPSQEPSLRPSPAFSFHFHVGNCWRADWGCSEGCLDTGCTICLQLVG